LNAAVKRGRPLTNSELAASLCEASVPLREAHRIHLRHYGTLVPHVFMADVLRRIGQCLAGRPLNGFDEDANEMRGILDAIELGMSDGDRETRNVIALSFARDSEVELFFHQLEPLMGPHTRAQLAGR